METEQKYINLGVDIIVIAFLLILSVALMLVSNSGREGLLIGSESYYHLRIAEDPFARYDGLSYSGRSHIFNAWPMMLNIFSNFSGVSLMKSSIILPFIFGFASLVVFYFLLRKLKVSFRIRALSAFILSLSPGFIYLESVSTDVAIVAFLLLSSFILFLYNKNLFAYILLLTVPFFGILNGIVAFLITLIFSFNYNIKRHYSVLFALLFMVLWPFFVYGMPTYHLDWTMPKELISDLGGIFGMSIFVVFLSFAGIAKLWERKYRNMAPYLLLILFLVLTFFNAKSLLYLTYLAAFLASLGFIKLAVMEWQSRLIKSLLLVIIIAGLIFSVVSYLNFLPKEFPDKDTFNAMKFISENSDEGNVVLSHPNKGHWISSMAGRRNFMDDTFFFSPDLTEREKDFDELISTKDLDRAILIMNKYEIKYIYIDPTMRSILWNKDEEGLLFLLKFSKKFKKVYNKNNYDIYEVM